MSIKRMRMGAIALGMIATLMTGNARAADPGFCQNYAQSAMNEIQRAHQIPNCANRLSGGRWNFNYNNHFNWCLNAPYEAANSERYARRQFLEQCEHGY